MLSTIDFNDQAVFSTDKVHNARKDRLLPHKLHSIQRTRTEPIPNVLLSKRCIPSQPPCNTCSSNVTMHVPLPTYYSTVFYGTALVLPLPPWGERVGVRGACRKAKLTVSHQPYTFSTSGRPSRP
jgi:hypothetical protein